jgi:hypothetical protein
MITKRSEKSDDHKEVRRKQSRRGPNVRWVRRRLLVLVEVMDLHTTEAQSNLIIVIIIIIICNLFKKETLKTLLEQALCFDI